MFNLFRSRDKAVRIMLGGLLLVVAISMLTYLVPSYDAGTTGSGAVVASVGSDEITATDVQKMVQNTMRGKQLPPDMLPIYLPQLVDEIIAKRAMAYEADRLGFEVSNLDVSSAIQQMIPSLFPDGRFVANWPLRRSAPASSRPSSAPRPSPARRRQPGIESPGR